jgi:hypothetical protein
MKILLDHCVNKRFRQQLSMHEVKTAREMGWDALKNGELLKAVAGGGFDLFLSIDKKLRYEQNLTKLPVCIVVLDSASNALLDLMPFVEHLRKLLASELGPRLYFLERGGGVTIL